MENRKVHKCKSWFVRLAILCGVLFLTPHVNVQAASKKSWTVKVNKQYQAKLLKKGSQWYLQSADVQMKELKATERVAYLSISSKSGLKSGYYYFYSNGKLDKRKKFHTLDTRIGTVTFQGTYYFGETSGRLKQKAGVYTISGKKYGLDKWGKMMTDRWYKGCYFLSNGTMAKSMHISETLYVDGDGKKCTKEEVNLGSLKRKIQNAIKGYSGSWSVYVKDLKTGDVISINETSMYPASVIKLFVMEATYASAAEKRTSLNSSTKSLLRSMITVSDNESYNALVRKVGKGSFASGCSYINKYLKKNGYTGTAVHHTLHPSSSSYQSDGGGSNRSSAKDIGKLLEKIYNNTAVSKTYSKQMLNLMLKQQRRWKIPAGLPSGVKVANKTGETDSYQHDAAIVFGKKTDYVIVVFSRAGEYSGINGIKKISRMVYDYLN